MSDAIKEAFGLEEEQLENEEQQVEEDQEQEQEQEQEEQTNPELDKASNDGWVPKSEWVERGNDPDDWVSAKKFNERGSMIGQIKALQSRVDKQSNEFEQRIKNQNKLHEVQQQALIRDLEAKRNNAIQEADVEEVNRIQGEIDNAKSVNPEPDAPVDGRTPEMIAWEDSNPWINDAEDVKAIYAQARWGTHVASGKTVTEALAAVDADIAAKFPPVNQNRNQAPSTEGSRSRPGRRQERKLAWSDLSRDEEKYYHAVPEAWKNKDEYLQAVADSRKGN